MGLNHFEKTYQKVPIEIGMGIAIAIGFVSLISFIGGGQAPYEKNEGNKANGNGNAHANFDWCFLLLFSKWFSPI